MIEALTLVSLLTMLAVYMVDSFKDTTSITLAVFSLGFLMFVIALYNALTITFSDVFVVAFAYNHFNDMYSEFLYNNEEEDTDAKS